MPHSMSCLCLMIQHSRNWPPAKSVSSCILQTLYLQIITYSVHQVRMLSQLCTVSLVGRNREYVYSFIAWHLSVKLVEFYYPSQDWDFFQLKIKLPEMPTAVHEKQSLLCTFLSGGELFGRWREDITVMGQSWNAFELLFGRRCFLPSLGVSLNENSDKTSVFVLMFWVFSLLSLHHI